MVSIYQSIILSLLVDSILLLFIFLLEVMRHEIKIKQK